MQGPRLNTLQNDGVQGCRDSTLQGACENGVASMECRCRASAVPAIVTAAADMMRQKTMRPSMTQTLEGSPTQPQSEARDSRYQARRRSRLREPRLHGFFFTSLMLEKL